MSKAKQVLAELPEQKVEKPVDYKGHKEAAKAIHDKAKELHRAFKELNRMARKHRDSLDKAVFTDNTRMHAPDDILDVHQKIHDTMTAIEGEHQHFHNHLSK